MSRLSPTCSTNVEKVGSQRAPSSGSVALRNTFASRRFKSMSTRAMTPARARSHTAKGSTNTRPLPAQDRHYKLFQ